MKQLRVVLLTSGQPSLNPRLVKEADALAGAGYEVTVLYAYWNAWGAIHDKQLLPKKKWKAKQAGGDPQHKRFIYFISRLIYKASSTIIQIAGYHAFAEFAIARSSYFLIKEAKKHQADLYIAHNLGALSAAFKAALLYKKPCGFDAEDFHRNEITDDTSSFSYKIAKYLEDKYYNKLDYITTSSPQITGRYRQLYPNLKPFTILNVFPKNIRANQRSINSAGPVKLFWFSQTIGVNRGIEDMGKALKILKAQFFELHLLGHIDRETQQEFIAQMFPGVNNVFFHEPVPSDEIINFAAQFDIGLALENTTPLNRDICLTNKIFTYLQAGLTIVASDTTAQKAFLNEHPEVGKLYQKAGIQSLVSVLSNYQSDRIALFNTCEASLKLGREKLNWENESVKFLNLVKEVVIVNGKNQKDIQLYI